MSVTVPNSEFIDYYKLLSIEVNATAGDVRASFLKAAKASHPDAGGSTEQMQLLNQAYKTLTGGLSRAAYDRLYTLHTNVRTSNLDLHDDYTPSKKRTASDDAQDDMFVDQIYSEYYGKESKQKKKSWVKKLFGA